MRNISSLLNFFDNPHKKFYSIHIAGTNGKGSSAAYLAAICISSGYKTGLYTSPHLLSLTERIRINGKKIPLGKLNNLIKRFQKEINRFDATFFEAMTAIAFQYFAEEKVEIAIVETGLGGRLDATNVVTPILSLITNISLEHTDVLGNSLSKIAFEKSGIIKKNIPCVTNVIQHQSLSVLKRIAHKKNAQLYEASKKPEGLPYSCTLHYVKQYAEVVGPQGKEETLIVDGKVPFLFKRGGIMVFNGSGSLCIKEIGRAHV